MKLEVFRVLGIEGKTAEGQIVGFDGLGDEVVYGL